MNIKPGDQIQVKIDKMSLHGGGVARHEGFVFFIDYAAPGDELLIRILEVKKNHGFAKIEKIISPSPSRKAPPCPYFGVCGGCSWQHLSDEFQVSTKQVLVRELLEKTWQAPLHFLPLVVGPDRFRYRNRIQLKKKDDQVGYFEPRSHNLVPIDDCLLAEESLIAGLPNLKKQKARTKSNSTEPFETWEISLSADLKPQIQSLDQRDLAFSQVNRFINEQLINTCLDWSEQVDFDFFWDLYCGSGNLTFPFTKKYKKIKSIGVEYSGTSIGQAQKEALRLGFSPKNLEFFCSDVATFLTRSSPQPKSLLLVDPPRAGLDEKALRAIVNSKAEAIFYISCNPMTLARDLGRIKELNLGWKTGRVQCFDMFPQTEHVETLIELRR